MITDHSQGEDCVLMEKTKDPSKRLKIREDT